MALINCTECGKEISDKAAACPNCGAPISNGAGNTNQCPKCNTPYITEQKAASVSPVFILTIPMLLVGLSLFLFNWLAALLVIGLAFMIDHFGRSKKAVLICPKCRYEPY